MEIISINEPKNKIIERATQVLEKGGLVVYPTETCYGIGADATNPKAISKLLDYKARREGKPLSVVISEKEKIREYVELNEMAENIYDNYLPGPITVVAKSLGKVTQGVESESGTLGIRVPDYDLILEISKNFGKPFTATSANMSYKPKPYSVEKLFKQLPKKKKELIDLVIDGGELPKNEASTVLDTTLNSLNVLRKGKYEFEKDFDNEDAVLTARTNSEIETVNFGSTTMLKYLDELDNNCVVFLLSGELGTGKTQFTKGIAKQLGIEKIIKSPTYNVLNEYEFYKGKLVHIDLWKVYFWQEIKEMGLEDYINVGNVFSVEWSEKFFSDMKEFFQKKDIKMLKVSFEYIFQQERNIKIFEL